MSLTSPPRYQSTPVQWSLLRPQKGNKSFHFFFQIPFYLTGILFFVFFAHYHERVCAVWCFTHFSNPHTPQVFLHVSECLCWQNLQYYISWCIKVVSQTVWLCSFRQVTSFIVLLPTLRQPLRQPVVWEGGGSVFEVTHTGSHALYSHWEYFLMTQTFLFVLKTEYQSNNGQLCDTASRTMDSIFSSQVCGSVIMHFWLSVNITHLHVTVLA